MAAFVGRARRPGANRIADLFCGVGTFTFRLAEIAPVHAVDSAPDAVGGPDGGAGRPRPGLKGVTAEARDLARRPLLAHDLQAHRRGGLRPAARRRRRTGARARRVRRRRG